MPGGISYIQDLVIDGSEITSQSVGDKSLKSTCADADTIEVSSTTGKLQLNDAGSAKANCGQGGCLQVCRHVAPGIAHRQRCSRGRLQR